MTGLRPLLPLVLLAALSACVSQSIKSTSVPAIETPDSPVPEKLLLDVGVEVFDPGIEDYEAGEDDRIYPEVRKAEARYIPGLLVDTLQNSGAWGAVRIIPDEDQLVDLRVEGEILHSDGESLKLAITATDSRGEVWLDRTYTGEASSYAYEATTRNPFDPFQAVYHTIANDLLEQLQGRETAERERIRLVTELLFARSFAPKAFSGYMERDREGIWQVRRLPAKNDPMLERVREIRERDRMFVDTLQEYYNNFALQMSEPYQEWRKLSYEEVVALQEVRSDSRQRLLAGAAAILGGIFAAASGESGFDGALTRTAGHVAILGGGYLLKSGLERRAEAQIHVEALEELGLSLESEITPQVIELEDETVTLKGSVQEQYAQWRALLADIYRAEIGELAVPAETAAATDTL